MKTLDDLTVSLPAEGFDSSRSGFYLRLLPRNVRTIERYVNVAPVKLIRPKNSQHKSHVSAKFARVSTRYLEEIAGFLGPEDVTFLFIFHDKHTCIKTPLLILNH